MMSTAHCRCSFTVLLIQTIAVFSFSTTAADAQVRDRYGAVRVQMVKEFIEKEGITNKQVLRSMRTVPRHYFVPPMALPQAYLDIAIPIGYEQTISPPFVVAYMTQTIDPLPTDKVLEIGTGSGYQAAVLSGIAKEVYSIEIVPQLGQAAAMRLKRLGYKNVKTKVDDGFKGWKEYAPFDKIIVTCSPEKVPQPLIDQLKEGGKMLIPLGERYQQVFHLLQKKDGKLKQAKLIPTLFVPMTGVSEANRKVKPDPANPQIVNGSFEIDENKDGRSDGWYYQRQLSYLSGGGATGSRYITFKNQRPGRLSQLLQGTAVDGRRVGQIRLSAAVKFERTAAGNRRNEVPGIVIHFFDAKRKTASQAVLGPFIGTNGRWMRYRKLILVPVTAREAVIQVGLNGGTGEMSVDDVEITPIKR